VLEVFTSAASAHPALIAGGIFLILLLCGFGLPLPEDIVLAFTGYVVYLNVLPLWAAIAIGLGGVVIGDSTLWWLGRRYGGAVMRLRGIRNFLPPARLEKIQKAYCKYGTRMLFTARFTPVMRAGVFLFAGWARVSYLKFICTDGTAAVISVPAIIVVTYFLGSQIDRAVKAIRGVEHWILIAIGVAVVAHIVHGRVVKRREARAAAAAGLDPSAPPSIECPKLAAQAGDKRAEAPAESEQAEDRASSLP